MTASARRHPQAGRAQPASIRLHEAGSRMAQSADDSPLDGFKPTEIRPIPEEVGELMAGRVRLKGMIS